MISPHGQAHRLKLTVLSFEINSYQLHSFFSLLRSKPFFDDSSKFIAIFISEKACICQTRVRTEVHCIYMIETSATWVQIRATVSFQQQPCSSYLQWSTNVRSQTLVFYYQGGGELSLTRTGRSFLQYFGAYAFVRKLCRNQQLTNVRVSTIVR